MKRLLSIAAIVVLMAALFFVVQPARGDVDQRIQALEDELARLKGEQMELKREATAAAAALPAFSYRPGSGILMEAADKSWSLRTHLRLHTWVVFEEGKDQVGRSRGEVAARRVRPTWYFCLNNCFYEAEIALDLDGFQTGSGHSSGADTTNGGILQRAVGYVHFENINPWLPTFYMGADGPADISSYRQGSSNISAQLEYDILSRNAGFNTGRFGTGMGLRWEDVPLRAIGIPGRMRASFTSARHGEGDDGKTSNTDRKSFSVHTQIQPFTQLKNKWLTGLGFSVGAWFCNFDDRASDNGCDELRIRDHGPFGRQDLFRTDSGLIGDGTHHAVTPSFRWAIGPYELRAHGYFQRYENSPIRGRDFLIAHQLNVWSPKGWLTGGVNDRGTFFVGYHFERTDVSCSSTSGSTCEVSNQFHRNRIILNEWDMWYVIQRGMNVGLALLWYDASNLRSGNGRAQENLLETNSTTSGKGGDWLDVILAWRWQF
ncbi:MAG: hypothetical protein HY695_26815 [Deltaproteobacteria bacterium]|nr:hypothetical protein [Deltaproteobacteria bacterium]